MAEPFAFLAALARSGLVLIALVAAAVALAACEQVSTPITQGPEAAPCVADPVVIAGIHFERSPGGVPEVDVTWVHDNHCNARVVDVREAAELRGPLGAMPYAEHVPMDRLLEESAAWDPDEPVVLICRSGRRSARGVRMLEDLGFTRAASLSGGMLVWNERNHSDPSYPVTRPVLAPLAPAAVVAHPLGGDAPQSLEERLENAQVHWVKVAGLLMQGTQSCVDGRDPRPVVGTPGGDAGELLLALAALERVRGEPIVRSSVGPIVDSYIDAFGRFYIHSDTHALEELGAHLRLDPAFAVHLGEQGAPLEVGDVEALLRNPPHALERQLLDALVTPAHVGCGHLRLVLLHPDEYGVRNELAEALLREVFQRLWQGDPIDFVVLEGEHHESAVINVVLDQEIHPFTRIPTAAPHSGSRDLFINHPQVSAWLREQNASFFFEIDPWLHADPARRTRFLEMLSEMGDVQLTATLGHLASRLPIYEAHVSPEHIRLVGPVRGEADGAPVAVQTP